nr:hypothetical protein [Tanacetum cinerariifolium]
MIHLVIHLPLDAHEGGPIRPRWMFPREKFMKKLNSYVRNKAKPESSIAEGYVAEEALTFSSHYFQDVTTKFNRPDRNVDPPSHIVTVSGVPITIPEIDTYRSQFKSKFPNKDMKEEFPNWFGSHICQRHIDNDPGVIATSELFALACGPTPTLISVNSCVVNGVRFVVHSHDERRTTQNSSICSPGGKDGEINYGQLQEILEFSYCHLKLYCSELSGLTLATKDMLADVARGHGGDGGSDDRPSTHHIPGCGGCFANRGKGTQKPNLGGRKADRLHTRQETRNLGLKKITDDKGPV